MLGHVAQAGPHGDGVGGHVDAVHRHRARVGLEQAEHDLEQQGNREAMLEQLQILLKNQQHDYDSSMVLASAALEQGDLDKAEYYVGRALAVDPYRLDVHQAAAAVAEARQNTSASVREHEILVQLDVNDPVEARTNLAQAYLSNGQSEEARRNILRALEVAPTYLRAQQLLLRSVGEAERR